MHEHVFVQPKPTERERAREMRARGASLRIIARDLGVALSSVSVWVRDVPRATDLLVAAGATPASAMTATRLPVWSPPCVRWCYRCKRLLPDVAFGRDKDRRQYRCRRCCREYFIQRGDLHRQQSARAHERRRSTAKAHVLAYLQANACVDCGEADPVVLEFDHLGDKTASISELAHAGVRPCRLDEEIARCDVVCACCHRRRTQNRRPESVGEWMTPRRRRNIAFVRSILERTPCIECGMNDPQVLEFDHVADKTRAISDLVYREASLDRLRREIDQCEVRCANCHRRQTATRGRHFRSLGACA
jgi:hypothetical protein